ncbi:MAG: hypothetical protein ACR2OO_01615 [Thermomicrobiales bacterium]
MLRNGRLCREPESEVSHQLLGRKGIAISVGPANGDYEIVRTLPILALDDFHYLLPRSGRPVN